MTTSTIPSHIVAFSIQAPAQMLTTNRERTLHWSKRAEVVALWRNAAFVLAKQYKVPAFAHADVDFTIQQARGKLADASAHHPVTKAILDGLIDAHVLPDDDPSHVTSITEQAPVRGPNGVVVTLKGEVTVEVTKQKESPDE